MAAPALADWDHLVKWDQLDPGSGWGGASFVCYDTPNDAITADDFFCDGTLPIITDIEFYGWSHYGSQYVDSFRITFRSDVPATPEDESHPGDLLWECQVPGQELADNLWKVN